MLLVSNFTAKLRIIFNIRNREIPIFVKMMKNITNREIPTCYIIFYS